MIITEIQSTNSNLISATSKNLSLVTTSTDIVVQEILNTAFLRIPEMSYSVFLSKPSAVTVPITQQ